MRILLLYPPPWKIPRPGENEIPSGEGPYEGWTEENRFGCDEMRTPYGLLSIAAQAKRAGHHVMVLNIYPFAWKDIEKIIVGTKAELYGLSCFTHNRRGTHYVARLIREVHPRARIIVGGPHAGALPKEVLEYWDEIDAVAIGEGERTFMEAVERIESGKDFRGVAGLAFRTEFGIEIGPDRERIEDLDSLASPYEYFEGDIMITSRGCPGTCTFCISPSIWGRKVRFHSPEYVLRILDRMVNVFGHRALAIKDDTFTSNRNRVLRICNGIQKKDLRFVWSCDTRVDALDEEVLLAMRKAGCKRISLGVESGSPTILKGINKRTTPEKVLAVTEMAKRFGFQIRYYMIAGNRGETAETLKESVDFLIRAKPNQFIFYFLMIFPGTREFELAEQAGMVTRDSFFTRDWPYFAYPLPNQRTPDFDQILNWIYEHPGIHDFWDYGKTERQAILSLLPDEPVPCLEMGAAEYQAGELEKAEEHFGRALALGYPVPAVVYNYLACIAASRGDLPQTIHYLEKACGDTRLPFVIKNIASLHDWMTQGPAHQITYPKLTSSHEFELEVETLQPLTPGPIHIDPGFVCSSE